MRRKIFEHYGISIPSHQAMQAFTMNKLDENKPLQNAFNRIQHCIYWVVSGVRTHTDVTSQIYAICKQIQQLYSSISAIGPISSIGCLVLQSFWFTSSVGSLVLLVHQFYWFTSSAGSLDLLVQQFCWFASSVGSLVVLVCQFCWFTSSAGSLVLLVHQFCWFRQFCWFTSSVGSLVLLVHEFCWFASFVGSALFTSAVASLVLLVHQCRWFTSSVGSIKLAQSIFISYCILFLEPFWLFVFEWFSSSIHVSNLF